MKVVFRISDLGTGGAERVFISLAEYLVNYDDAEVVFVVDHIRGFCVDVVKSKGFQVYDLNARRTFFSISLFCSFIDLYKPDIIISAYPDTNAGAIISSKLAKHFCPVIVTEHASIRKHWAQFSLFRRLLVNFFVSTVYRYSSHVVCVSQGLALEVSSILKKPNLVSYIYNPVRFSACIDSDLPRNGDSCFNLLAVGRISLAKDYLMLLKSMVLLKEKLNVKLRIVGHSYEKNVEDQLINFIKENSLDDCVELIGFSDNIDYFYKSADLFVLSSAWEGFGNVIVEALAFGLPVVSTDCESGPAEILQNGKYGRLVPVGDYEGFANQIEMVLIEKPYLPSNQILRSRYFSEENIGARYLELIKSLI